MRARLLLGCLVLLAVTAFAPAPFPKPQRPGSDGVGVAQVQGKWVVLGLQSTDGKGGLNPPGSLLREVHIDNHRWSFHYRNPRTAPTHYRLAIDTTKAPAHIDFYHEGQATPYGTGIVARRGNTLRVLYQWGSPRATSFDRAPAGYWHITLEKR
jgi:uncharacterized protein (TIGR03067 family)